MIIFAAYGICFVFVRFYEATVEGRSLRSSGAGLQEEEEEESGEEEPEEGKDYSWKKTIMIGPSYQVAKNTNTEHFFLPGLRIHAFLNALPHAAYYIRPAILSPLNAITTATSLWLVVT